MEKQWKMKLTCKLGIIASLQYLNRNAAPILPASQSPAQNSLKPRSKPTVNNRKPLRKPFFYKRDYLIQRSYQNMFFT